MNDKILPQPIFLAWTISDYDGLELLGQVPDRTSIPHHYESYHSSVHVGTLTEFLDAYLKDKLK